MHLLKRLCAWLRTCARNTSSKNTNSNNTNSNNTKNTNRNKNNGNSNNNHHLLSQAAVNTSIARDMGVRVSRIRLPSGEEIVLVEREPRAEDVDGDA